MADTTHRAFFGDAEYAFRLTGPMIIELEHKTGGGIGALFDRVLNRQFRHVDLVETIRCALIGGGTAPADAARLIAAYAVDRPLTETMTLALAILEAVFFGAPVAVRANPAPEPAPEAAPAFFWEVTDPDVRERIGQRIQRAVARAMRESALEAPEPDIRAFVTRDALGNVTLDMDAFIAAELAGNRS